MTILAREVDVDRLVYGESWTVSNHHMLVEWLAVICLGQAQHAARIINQLEPSGPAISVKELFAGARGQLYIKGQTESQKEVSRYHRDGFLFECISWIVARQENPTRAYLKDPHLSATSQGLDGLMIIMHENGEEIVSSTIFEDKCTTNPRDKFRDEIIPVFSEHHEHKRGRDLVANATSLIRESGLDGTAATKAAAKVLDKTLRFYRAALTVGAGADTTDKRKSLFKGFDGISDVQKQQRIGAMFSTTEPLRDWFQALASDIIGQLNKFEAEKLDV